MHSHKHRFLSALLFVALIPSVAIGSLDSMTLISEGDVRYMGFIKVYDAYLYAFDKEDQARILSPEVSKCLKLNYEVGLKPEDFIAGASTVLDRQHSKEYLDLIKPHVDKLHSAYRAVDKGDSYLLCYDADSGLTTLSLNAEELVAIDSGEFSTAYFGIWLSPDNPLSPGLQKQLAGPKDS